MEGGGQAGWTDEESTQFAVTPKTARDALLRGLGTRAFGHSLFVFDEIDSTNTCAAALSRTGTADGTVVWADHQTAGKGRHGRLWIDTPGDNLTFSLVLRDLPASGIHWVPYYVAEGIAAAVESLLDVEIATKWPNDLLVGGKKFSGTLLERSGAAESLSVIAGIGINVNQTEFPPDLERTATSLSLHTGTTIDRIRLYQTVLKHLEDAFQQVRSGREAPLIDAWKARCVTLDTRVSVHIGSEVLSGTAVGLADDGGLLLETDMGTRTVYAGDVTLVPAGSP